MAEVKRDMRNPLLFECAWEVANKVSRAGMRASCLGRVFY